MANALATAGLLADETGCDPITRAHEVRQDHGDSLAAYEGARLWRDTLLAESDRASPRLRLWAANRAEGSPEQHEALLRSRRELIDWFTSSIPAATAVVLPATPIEPPTFGSLADDNTYRRVSARAHSLLWPFNELDAPAVSLPCGRTAQGLPVALQIVTPRGRDHEALHAAALAESALRALPADSHI